MTRTWTSVFVDTNVLVYTRDLDALEKRAACVAWLRELGARRALKLSLQSLNELYSVLIHRKRLDPVADGVRGMVEQLHPWADAPLNHQTRRLAWQIQDQTGFRYYDSLLLASATQAGCDLFLSEDLQHARKLGDLTIVNPFMVTPQTALAQED